MCSKGLSTETETENEPEEPLAPGNTTQHILMPLMNSAWIPGHCLETVQAIKDTRQRNIAMGEYYYFSGHPEEAAKEMEPYLASPDTPLRLSACLVYAYAELAADHIRLARHALNELQITFANINENDNASPELKAMSSFVSVTAAVLLHLPLKGDLASASASLSFLPSGLQYFFCYVQAHYTYLRGDYSRSIGIVETALAFQSETYPISDIYLHLVASMDYMSLKETDKAREQLMLAWNIARPDGLIEAFGEHHGLLGGMLEVALKNDYPDDFKRIINITYAFSRGWMKVHNPDTGHDVADNLTTTEFAIAMLASRDWTYQEISSHMGISTNTVKTHIKSVLSKLGITKKSELKKYMLR